MTDDDRIRALLDRWATTTREGRLDKEADRWRVVHQHISKAFTASPSFP